MVLTTLADGLLNTAQGIYDTGADIVGTPTIRLGVTGLARSGKTVFITSLVANLLDRGRMPHLLAAAQGRVQAAYLQPQPNDTIPRFDYEAHKAS
ncbi:MAG: YcjX family protein, partial [Pseudomonadota bacterium]